MFCFLCIHEILAIFSLNSPLVHYKTNHCYWLTRSCVRNLLFDMKISVKTEYANVLKCQKIVPNIHDPLFLLLIRRKTPELRQFPNNCGWCETWLGFISRLMMGLYSLTPTLTGSQDQVIATQLQQLRTDLRNHSSWNPGQSKYFLRTCQINLSTF